MRRLPIGHGGRRRPRGGPRAGVIHRDIKPGNIAMRPDGTVKVWTSDWQSSWARGVAAVGRNRSACPDDYDACR